MPELYPDSSLPLLSDPAGWPDAKNLWTPVLVVVVPRPTILAFISKIEDVSFCICNLIKSFSNFAVKIPTLFVLKPNCLSTNISDVVTSVPSKSNTISL